MDTGFEAKFYPIDKVAFIASLPSKGATLLQSETKTTIAVYNRRTNPQIKGDYIRIRDEGNAVRLSVKVHALEGGNIADQKETDTIVSDFESTAYILECAGLKRSGLQEKMRETWELDGAEIVIDTWPGLNPYIEVEASTESEVKRVAVLIGLPWDERIITSVVEIYMREYGITLENTLDLLHDTTFANNPFEALVKQ